MALIPPQAATSVGDSEWEATREQKHLSYCALVEKVPQLQGGDFSSK